MKVLAVAIQKGGTGKTTTAAALAQAGVYSGRRVLAVDLDPQGNLSLALGATGTEANAYSVLTGEEPAADNIIETAQGIDVIPAGSALSTVRTSTGSARRLHNALEPIKGNYDLIIIDTPPTAGELQYNALMTADGLIIPLQADAFNLQSLYQITATARQIQKSNGRLQILGIIFTQYDRRSIISRQMRDAITSAAEGMNVPTLGAIRGAVAIKEAAALQRSLYSYAPKSNPAQDYLDIYKMIAQDAQEV